MPPWDRENHLQKCRLGGDMLVSRRLIWRRIMPSYLLLKPRYFLRRRPPRLAFRAWQIVVSSTFHRFTAWLFLCLMRWGFHWGALDLCGPFSRWWSVSQKNQAAIGCLILRHFGSFSKIREELSVPSTVKIRLVNNHELQEPAGVVTCRVVFSMGILLLMEEILQIWSRKDLLGFLPVRY